MQINQSCIFRKQRVSHLSLVQTSFQTRQALSLLSKHLPQRNLTKPADQQKSRTCLQTKTTTKKDRHGPLYATTARTNALLSC